MADSTPPGDAEPKGRKYLFLTPPATGELQPIYAIVCQLLSSDPSCRVWIGSGSSFSPRFSAFLETLEPKRDASRLFRVDLGDSDAVQDYSKGMLDPNDLAEEKRHLYNSHRHARGDPRPFLDYWEHFASGSERERLETVQTVRSVIMDLTPDMIVVDQIYGTPFDAVRSTGLPFIIVAPSHPSFSAADVNPFMAPISMSGIRWEGTLRNVYHNVCTIFHLCTWIFVSRWAQDTLRIRRKHLGFKKLSIPADSAISPPPGLVDEVCATITCNIPDLHFYNSFHPKVVFTGPCFRPNATAAGSDRGPTDVTRWLDEAQMSGEKVVFITFGSMFPFTAQDYRSMIEGLKKAHSAEPHFRVLWKIVRTKDNQAFEALDFVKETGWLPSVDEVYGHPATKVVVHHGGGNTVNEVIYHGLTHLAIPQWSDTYDWAATVEGFSLGLQVRNVGPSIDSAEVEKQLLCLLRNPERFARAVGYWQRRCRESGGTAQAADLIAQKAKEKCSIYRGLYSKVELL